MFKIFLQKFAVVTASIIFSAGIFTGCSDSFDAINAGSTRESASRAAFAASGDRIYAVAESAPKDRLQFRLDLGKTLASGTTFTFYTTYNCNNTFPTGTKLTVRDGSGSYTKYTTTLGSYISGTSDSSRNGWYPVTVTTKNSTRYIGFTYSGEFKKDSVIAIKYISIAPSFDAADWSTFSTDTQIRFEEKKPNEFRVMPEAENIEEPPVINDPAVHVLHEPVTKNASMLTSNVDRSKVGCKINFTGKWDKIKDKTYKTKLENLFYEYYPKLLKRWGTDNTYTTINFEAKYDDDCFAGTVDNNITISIEGANDSPYDLGYFAHELAHVVQGYKIGMEWFCEGMASYAGFRYFHWQHEDTLSPLFPASRRIQTWTDYAPYGDCVPFFVYMDDKYPTHMENGKKVPGLIDSLNSAAQAAEDEDDFELGEPSDKNSEFNKIVSSVTDKQFKTIEQLRNKYLEECRNGTWTFNGFKDFKDNFLTENIRGVPNVEQIYVPAIKHASSAKNKSSLSLKENIFKGAKVVRSSGCSNGEKDSYLVDGKTDTKWYAGTEVVTDNSYAAYGAQHYVLLDLGKNKDFDSYILRNTCSGETGEDNASTWELLTSVDGKNFTPWDYQRDKNVDIGRFTPGNVTARYILMLVYESEYVNNPKDSFDVLRLYELMGGLKK